MSGGSYDYLFTRVQPLDEQRGMLENMAMRLEGLPYATEAAAQTRRVLRLLDAMNAAADSLPAVWRAVEWWDSCDSGEDAVISACEAYRAPELIEPEGNVRAPNPGTLYRLIDVGNGVYELRPVVADAAPGLNAPSDEFLADLTNPIRLEPHAVPIRDGGRRDA